MRDGHVVRVVGGWDDPRLDVLVVGGGIMGAAVMREAARAGLSVLLVERHDFASGTSSRSSKLIHGGLHYLLRFQLALARSACADRNELLEAGAGLIDPLTFRIPSGQAGRAPDWGVRAILGAYGLLGGAPGRGRAKHAIGVGSPAPDFGDLGKCASYVEGVTDDARLVLRVIREGEAVGGSARNYVAVTGLVRGRDGRVLGARIRDGRTGATRALAARCVVNATGAWSDQIGAMSGAPARLRLLRGSHIVLPWRRLPLTQAVAGVSDETARPVYALPWRGVTIVGSTSIEHHIPLDREPTITADEARYLLDWVDSMFPTLRLGPDDVQTTFAGIRAMPDPRGPLAHASRAHRVFEEQGMLTVTGGKLTGFPSVGRQVLPLLWRLVGARGTPPAAGPALDPLPDVPPGIPLEAHASIRILARYGPDALNWFANRAPAERAFILGTRVSLADLRWAAREENVRSLADLALRRTRIGLTVPGGGIEWLQRWATTLRSDLGWDHDRWRRALAQYGRTVRVAQAWREPAEPSPAVARVRSASATRSSFSAT